MDEPGSREAREGSKDLLKAGQGLCMVDLALAEGLNAIWKHVKIHGDLSPDDGRSAIKDLNLLCGKLEVLSTHELSKEAFEIALREGLSVYDSLYIAAARKTGATLWTADGKLHKAARGIVPAELLASRSQ